MKTVTHIASLKCKTWLIFLSGTVGIPMGTNVAPLFADLFLYSYESEFIQQLQRSGANKTNFVIRLIQS